MKTVTAAAAASQGLTFGMRGPVGEIRLGLMDKQTEPSAIKSQYKIKQSTSVRAPKGSRPREGKGAGRKCLPPLLVLPPSPSAHKI